MSISPLRILFEHIFHHDELAESMDDGFNDNNDVDLNQTVPNNDDGINLHPMQDDGDDDGFNDNIHLNQPNNGDGQCSKR